jgi:predicted dehydrogenase
MSARPSPVSVPRVAIIGVTGYAACHLALLREHAEAGRLRLCAATVINRAEAAAACEALERLGCEIFGDYRDMLAAFAGRLDLCLVPTAPQWHAEMTVAALDAGCHVLLEKPLAPTLAEIEAIQAAERRTGRWVAIGFQDMHPRPVRELRARIAAGEWGAVRSVSFSCFWPRAASYYSRNRWAGRLSVDGRVVLDSPLSNAMAHFSMLALHLAAPAAADATDAIVEEADLRRAYPIESFDTFVVRGRTPEGVPFRFAGSHACATETNAEVVVELEKARVVWRQWKRLVITPRDGAPEEFPLPDSDVSRKIFVDDVLGRLAGREVFTCSTAAAAVHARLYIGLHATHQIRDEDPRRVRRLNAGERESVVIEGILEELTAASAQGCAAG